MNTINKKNFFSVLGLIIFLGITLSDYKPAEGIALLDAIGIISLDDLNFHSIRGLGAITMFLPSFIYSNILINLNFDNFNLLSVVISCLIIYKYFLRCASISFFFLLLFLLIPAIFLSLPIFCKEFIFITFLYLFIYNYPYYNKKYLFLYLFFRPHYFFLLYFFSSNKKKILYGFLLILIIFNDQFYSLLIDLIYRKNFYLFNELIYYSNTQFKLLDFSYENFTGLILNYLYTLLQVHFSIFFFEINIKIIYFQIYIIIIYILIFYNFNIFSKILFFCIFFFTLIDVDLGQYLRHLSSFFLFFPLILFKNEKN
jgi:hypothetical protein